MRFKSLLLIGVFTCSAGAVEVDLSKAGMQPIAPNMIRLRNVTVPGYGNYWGDMMWDPVHNRLVVANAGPDTIPALSVTQTSYQAIRNSVPNFTQACQQEFGPASRQADWQEVKALLGSDNNALKAFIESNRIVPQDQYFITYGNRNLNDYGDPYILTRGDCGPVDSLSGGMLKVCYRYDSVVGRVVCTNPEAASFP